MIEIDNYKIKTLLFDISKKFILPKYKNLSNNDIMFKNKNDLVTVVDINVEEELNKNLLNIIPNSYFIGEEKFSKTPEIINQYNEKNYCWTVDPIDGTKNYINGKEKFVIMISLTYFKNILQTWIYNPLTEDLVSSRMNYGSYFNDKKLIITNTKNINDSIGSISSKYWDNDKYEKIIKLKNSFKKISSYGCIGLEYVDIARNIRDFLVLSKLYPWDHLPGILIVREAGGFDSYFTERSYNHCSDEQNLIVTGNYQLGKKILNKLME